MLKGLIRLSALTGCLIIVLALSACAQHQVTADQIKDMQAQIAEMQKSVANLNIRMEELNNSVFILQETTKANRDGLKTMKDQIEKPTIYINPNPVREANPSAPLPQGGETKSSAATVAPPASSSPPPAASSGPVDYDGAARLFSSGNYGMAAYELAAYLAKNPSASNAAQARYMLAESYYRLGDHSMAVREFALLLSRCSGSQCAKATLRSAQCFVAQGQSVKARELFKKVVSMYPGTDEAKAAEEELSKL
jgi:TolA-binding protein